MKLWTALLGMFALTVGVAKADPILYDGSLDDHALHFGSIADPFESGSDWWLFSGHAGDIITLTANRLSADLDPAFYVYFGIQTDTSTLPGFIAFGDDEIPELPGFEGPFADPQLSGFILPFTGFYTVAVWDFLSGSAGPHAYQIQLRGNVAVPEPITMAWLGLLLLLVSLRRPATVRN